MYKQDKECVLTSEGPTEMFECNIEVKQGCPASPLLFSLYLDELETMLEDAHYKFAGGVWYGAPSGLVHQRMHHRLCLSVGAPSNTAAGPTFTRLLKVHQ